MSGEQGLRIVLANSARKYIGEAAHCTALAQQLRARGHEVTVAVRSEYELEKRLIAAGIQVLPLRFNSDFRPLADWGDVRAFQRLLREFRADVVHCHRGKDHWIAAAAQTFGGPRVPIIRTRHVVVRVQNHFFNHWLFDKITARVIAVSQKAADSFGPMRRDLSEKLSVIYSAVDLDRFTPARRSDDWRRDNNIGSDEILVGLVARFQGIKGQEIFLKAASQIAARFPNVKFLLAGRGDPHRRDRFRKYSEKHGFADRLLMFGWLENVETLIASLDVGIVASLGSEGSSRITYEFMASGVPILATRVGGIPEILEHNETGLLVPPGHSGKLTEALECIITDEPLRNKLRQNALRRVTENHNFDRWISEVTAVYRSAIQEAPRSR